MTNLTRRSVIKSGIAASAGIIGPGTVFAAAESAAGAQAGKPAREPAPGEPLSPRQRLLLDFGWSLHLGDADSPAEDFTYGFVVPDALAELSAALWLAIKGVRLPTSTRESSSELVI